MFAESIISGLPMLQRLLEIGKRLLGESEIHGVLTAAIDGAIEFTGAERGMIILFGQSGETLFETARNLQKNEIEHPEFEVSHAIIDKVRTEETAVCLRNALEDPTLGKHSSVSRLKILSVICLPLIHEGRLFGVIYLDNRTVRGVFEAEVLSFMQEFADFISLAAHRALERKQMHRQVHVLESELRGKYQFESIIGHHPKMVEILKLVSQITNTDATVLIHGESGTGKELVARALHYNNHSRRDKTFVAINCGALAENLLESELFGHVRGAFTGAVKDHAGWFERADGGTIFLDEVTEMSPSLQVKVLRLLQTGEYARVGSTEMRRSNVRVVAAAGKDLQELIQKRGFREDLFYRLNVIDLAMPPLRDRKSDIPLLVHHFLNMYSAKHGRTEVRLSKAAETLLLAYDFPGNVRELENIVQRALVLAEGQFIEPQHLPATIYRVGTTSIHKGNLSTFKIAKQAAIEKFERAYLIECLGVTRGNISRAAQIAGINVKNFHGKMKKYGIDAHTFK